MRDGASGVERAGLCYFLYDIETKYIVFCITFCVLRSRALSSIIMRWPNTRVYLAGKNRVNSVIFEIKVICYFPSVKRVVGPQTDDDTSLI